MPDGYTGKSVAEYYLNLLEFLGIQSNGKHAEIFLRQNDQLECEAILKRLDINPKNSYLVVAPGGGESWGKDARLKRWPVGSFGKLIRELHRTYGTLFDKILILGGRDEHHLGMALLQECNGIVAHNLCGITPIRTAAALIQKASLFIGNDGGLVHIAHALNVPVIAFYGPVDPVVYGPHPPSSKALTITNTGPACRPCYERFRYQTECKSVECLTHLTADRVLDRIKSSRFLEQLHVISAAQ